MFILNKKNKVIQECINADAIKSCKKDSEHYAVAETREELAKMTATEPKKQPEQPAPDGSAGGDEKKDPEGTREGQGGNDGPAAGQEPESKKDDAESGWQNLPDEEKEADLNQKKVEELREIAKAMKIQGYGNMNKGTLVAMIMNH